MTNRTWKIAAAGAALGLALSGCSLDQVGDLGNKNIRTNDIKYNVFGDTLPDKRFAQDSMNERNRIDGRRQNSNNVVGNHKNYRLEMSSELSQKVAEVADIRTAYVMLADDNVYVAVSLEDTEETKYGAAQSPSRLKLFNGGSAETGKAMGSWATGEELLTEAVKTEIANVVTALRPLTVHIYISAAPEFVGRMSAYMNDAQAGHSVQNYVMEFNAMAERIFPLATPDRDGDGAKGLTTPIQKHRLLD